MSVRGRGKAWGPKVPVSKLRELTRDKLGERDLLDRLYDF